jgi:hypothetical protein
VTASDSTSPASGPPDDREEKNRYDKRREAQHARYRLTQWRTVRLGHAEQPQSQAVRRATELIRNRRYHAISARKKSQAKSCISNFFTNNFFSNKYLGRPPCILQTGLCKPSPCRSQGLCPVTGLYENPACAATPSGNAMILRPTAVHENARSAMECGSEAAALERADAVPRRKQPQRPFARHENACAAGALECGSLLPLSLRPASRSSPQRRNGPRRREQARVRKAAAVAAALESLAQRR